MYFLIGISLLFIYLYTVNLAGTLMSTAVWRIASGRFSRISARAKADLLFLLRVMPVAASVVLSLALIVPSFLLFEPHDSDETITPQLVVIVGLSVAGIIAASARILASWWRTRRLTRQWMRNAEAFDLEGFDLPAYRIEHPFPVLAVIGVLRPRIFAATQVLEALSPDELTAALAHEAGHVASRDNFKRVTMRVCGDMLVLPLGRDLDRRWLEAAESAADEFASENGGSANTLDLASALVKIGRITPPGKAWELPSGAYLTEPEDTSIATRVQDLVDRADAVSTREKRPSLVPKVLSVGPLVVLGLLVLPAFSQETLYGVHVLTEFIISTLQ